MSKAVRYCRSLALTIVYVAWVGVVPCIAQTTTRKEVDSTPGGDVAILPITATHVFTSTSPLASPPINLGELPAGEKVHVVVELRNSSETEFRIKSVRPSCSCLSVKTSARQINSGESVSLLAELKVPKSATSDTLEQILMIDGEAEGEIIQIVFKSRLQGLCCFKTQSHHQNVPAGVTEIPVNFPVLITAPVTTADVVVLGTGDFAKVNGAIERDGEGFVFRCKVPVPNKDSFSLSGEFILQHRQLDIKNSILCVFGRQPKMSLLPGVLHFVREGEKWHASAMVRVSRDQLKNSQDSLSIMASFGKIPISLEETKISAGTVRVRIEIKDSDAFNEGQAKWEPDSKIHWQVGWEGGISETDVAFTFK